MSLGAIRCTRDEPLRAGQQAVWGGVDDVSSDPTIGQAQADAVVRLTKSGAMCSGTLITPRAVLTAAHCVENSVASDWTVEVGADSKAWKTKRKVGSLAAASMPPQMPQRDVALLFLDSPVDTVISVRPPSNFSPPYNSMLIAGWSPLSQDGLVVDGGGTLPLGDASTGGGYRYRQMKFFTSLTPGTDLSNQAAGAAYYWQLNHNYGAGTNQGDSGGPLAVVLYSSDPYLNGARAVVGTLCCGDVPVNPTYGHYADVTRGDIPGWIAGNMLASAHGETHGPNWHNQHGTTSSNYWWGERDYTGPCKNGGDSNVCRAGANNGTDCDCDHWYDRGSVIHDNCPLIFNPEQADWNDDGMGDACDGDQDGDGIKDHEDDCVTVPDTSQVDTNFHAELELAIRAGVICATTGEPGHRPTLQDSQAYTDCWHQWFKGDACDADATTHNSLGGGENGETMPCAVLHKSGIPYITYEGSCPAALNTGFGFDSNIANASGTAVNATGTSAPAFCVCPDATTGSWSTIRSNCVIHPNYLCSVAADTRFPNLTQPPSQDPADKWKRITRWDGINFPYSALGTAHVQRKPYNQWLDFDTAPVKSTWNFRADLGLFGQPPSDMTMTGLVWTHVVSFTPGYGEGQPTMDLANHYVPIEARQQNALRVASDWALIEIAFMPCPIDPTYDTQAISVIGFVGGIEGFGTMAIQATETGLVDATRRFTPNALGLLANVYGGAYELLTDTAYETPLTGAGTPAILVDTGTTRIQGALRIDAGGKVDGATPARALRLQSTVAARAYSSVTGKLYSIETVDGATSLVARDVQAALNGEALKATTALTGASLGTVAALTYSPGLGALFALDTVLVRGEGTKLRLLRVDLRGAVRELWATRPMQSVPAVSLTASRQGALTLGATSTSGGYDVVLLDPFGVPQYSTSETSGRLKFAPVSNRRYLTIGRTQPFSPERWDLQLQHRTRSQLTAGLCGAGWLKSAADNGTALGNPIVDCP